MHDPYASLADDYDIMINWSERIARERPFFVECFSSSPIRQVLDVGCATGHHSRLFAELGATVIGLDPSVEMLQRARALTAADNPTFIEGDFRSISRWQRQFDLITVLGNTLAHVHDLAALQRTLRVLHDALAPGGQLCVQVINYDNFPADGSRWLPVLHRRVDGRDYLFLREHRLLHDRAEFTVITVQHDTAWQQRIERSAQLPLPHQLLVTELQQAGFTHHSCYGNYQRTPFDPLSATALVVLAS